MSDALLPVAAFHGPPTTDEQTLSRLPWAYTGSPRMAGNYRFLFRATDKALGVHLDRLLQGFPVGDVPGPLTTYSVLSGINGHANWWAVYADGTRISEGKHASASLTHLFAHLNRAVVEHCPPESVPLHAAVCSWRGRGVLVAGVTESGKSTLAAGLALRGFAYVTDEVAVIDPVTLAVTPYPKPPSIDEGAWPVLPTLRPVVPEIPTIGSTQWHVDPGLLGEVAVEDVPVTLLLRSRWRSGAQTALRPVSRAELVLELALDMFRPRQELGRQVQALARLAEQALAYELVYDHLDEAAEAIQSLLEG